MKVRGVRMYGEMDLRLEEFELPEIGDDEILAKIYSDSLCMSTYKLAVQGKKHKRAPQDIDVNPVIVGHEFAGTIIKVGKKWQDQFKPGMRFAQQPALNYKGSMASPGYSYRWFGGDVTYCIFPHEVMELGALMPFDGDSAVSVALMQLQSVPKRPREVNPGIPIGLEQITMKAMQKQPSDRYTSAAEMLSELERFRLNPSIVFDYGNSFVDNEPTKYVSNIKVRPKDEGNGVNRFKVEDEDFEEEENVIVEHGAMFYVVKGVLIAAITVCVVFFALALIQAFQSGQTKDVEVPDYVGKTLVQAKEDNPENFVFEINSKYDESKEIGTIIAQEPAAGSMKIKSGSTITLTVNGTDTEMTVPFVTNYSESEAVRAMKDKSLMPQVVYVENTKTPKGYVIDTFPAAGAKETIGSTVYIYIANGARAETAEIPAIIGSTLSDAQSKLNELNLTVEVTYNDESKEPKDTVIASSPLPYGKVDKGTVVTLIVSSGKGDKRSVEVYVDLPTNVEGSVEMTVIVDGAIDSSQSKTLIPAYNSTCTLKFEGSGTSNVVVQLDGQVYREYTIDFSQAAVTNTVTHEYKAPTQPATEAPVTEAPVTEAPVTPTEAPVDDGSGDYVIY